MSEIIISSGVTSTGLVAESGDIITVEAGGALVGGTINDGGTLNATQDAILENLTAAAGATVELTGADKTSGAILKGGNTNIAAGTLYYMGTAIGGEIANGVLSDLDGAYRICAGTGITVQDATVGGESTVGVRIYARETAVVSGGSVTTSGNVGLLGESYGNEVTVGGEGVTKATYNLFDQATADNTTVNTGGTFTVRDNTTAEGVTVNQGGQLNVSGGGVAAPVASNVTVNSDGTLRVSNGGAVSGGTVNRGGLLYVRDGEISDLTIYAKADSAAIQISGGGALMSGGTICGVATGKASAIITSGAVLRNVVLTTEATTSASNLLWVSAGDQPAASTGSAYGYNVTVDNFARLQIYHGVFSDTKVISGGWLYLNQKGVADNTLVSGTSGGNKAHMDINCAYGGYAINTWIASGGHVNVSAGKALNTIVNSGGVLKMAVATASATIDYNPWTGTISNTVGATVESQTVDQRTYNIYYGKDDGATGLIARYNRVEDLAVETGNSALVYDGAVVSGATVADGGTFKMTGGWVSGAAFGSNAQVDIAGGTVIDMYMRPVTSLYVSGGAVLSGGILEGGYLANGDSGAVIDAANFLVENAEMRNVSITTVAAGSSAGNKLPNYIWGNLGTGGSSYDVVVDRLARFQVQSKTAVAYRTSAISGGIFRVNSGTAYDTVLSGAWEDGTKAQLHMHNANGKAYDTTVDNDAYMVISNGKAYDTEVKSGGTLAVSAGSACDTMVYAGGSMFVYGGTVSGATLRNRFFASAGTLCDVDYLAAGEAQVSKTAVVSGGVFNADASHNLDLRVRAGGTVRDVTFTTVEGDASRGLARFGWGAGDSGYGYDLTIERYAKVQVNNGTLENVRVIDGGSMWMGANAEKSLATNVYISGRNAKVSVGAGTKASGSVVNAEIHSGGSMVVSSYSDAQNVLLNSGGYLNVQADASAQLAFNPWTGTTAGAGTITSHTRDEREFNVYWGKNDGKTGLLGRADTVDELTVESGNSAIVYKGGTVNDLTVVAGGKLYLSSGGVVRGLFVAGSMSTYAAVSNAGVCYGASAYDMTVASGGSVFVASGAYLSNVVIESGGSINVSHFCQIYNPVVSNGGQLHLRTTNIAAGGIYGSLTLDLAGTNTENWYLVTQQFNAISSPVLVKVNGEVADRTDYLVSNAGASTLNNKFKLDIGGGNVYDTDATNTEFFDPVAGLNYSRTRNQLETTTYDLRLETQITARKLATVTTAVAVTTDGETFNGSDRGARWTENTTYGDTVYVAQGMTAGNAWLEIDGTTVGTALYGAAAGQTFDGAVNIKLTSGSIRNLAGGAANGGTVANANFTMAGGTLAGAAYAGGMGNVTDAVKTVIKAGTLAEGKDFYAGALWNKQSAATSVGDVSLTVTGGTIGGNVYGASAVKTGTITTAANDAAKHTAGDVTFTLAGGTAENAEFCAFAGGYATGTDSAKLASVYDVGDVTIDITGGTWGDAEDARGGRGVFGGVMASGVKATAGNVSITVEAGTVANVFGGGWAQKGGVSTVKNVEITVTGGTVANIFGCGIHSVSVSENGASTTSVGNVSILLAGGNVTDNVYARGLIDGDAVTGDVTITVTGSANYGCNFYGFSRTAGEDDKSELVFAGYTGTISGEVNGFKEISLAGDTAMTFSNDANISNTAWLFDLADRTTSGTAFAAGEAADFGSESTITLNIGEGQELTGAWSIFDGGSSTTYGKFDVWVGGASILTEALVLDKAIASGDYAGWGFTVEDTVLKFKNLA